MSGASGRIMATVRHIKLYVQYIYYSIALKCVYHDSELPEVDENEIGQEKRRRKMRQTDIQTERMHTPSQGRHISP
jgi:hypothetical protein